MHEAVIVPSEYCYDALGRRRLPAYPLVLTNLDHVRVIVIGGGSVAERKINGLIAGGAHPVVVSPELTPALETWCAKRAITWLQRRYEPGDLAGAFLVIAATNDHAVNMLVAAEARRHGILANIGDDPDKGNCTTTATVRRGDLVVAVTTNGASPALTAKIRRELEAAYGEEYAILLGMLREIRAGRARQLPPAERTKLLRRLVEDDVLAWIRAGKIEQAWALAQSSEDDG